MLNIIYFNKNNVFNFILHIVKLGIALFKNIYFVVYLTL